MLLMYMFCMLIPYHTQCILFHPLSLLSPLLTPLTPFTPFLYQQHLPHSHSPYLSNNSIRLTMRSCNRADVHPLTPPLTPPLPPLTPFLYQHNSISLTMRSCNRADVHDGRHLVYDTTEVPAAAAAGREKPGAHGAGTPSQILLAQSNCPVKCCSPKSLTTRPVKCCSPRRQYLRI